MTVNSTPCTLLLAPGTYDVSCLGEVKRVEIRAGEKEELHFGDKAQPQHGVAIGATAIAVVAMGCLALAIIWAGGGRFETSRE